MYYNIFQSENVPIKNDVMHEYILKKQMETKTGRNTIFYLYYSMYNYIRFMLSVKFKINSFIFMLS